MTKLALVCVWAMICHYMQAQNYIKPLTVGDTVPDITFNNVLNYPEKTAKLSDFEDKLIILDFWATWCGTCIAHMPDMHALQNDFKDQLQILLVNGKNTGDSKDAIRKFLVKRSELSKPINLPIVPEEVLANRLFPYRSLPHYAWIKNRKVIAITGSDEISERNIKDALTNKSPSLKLKRDQDPRQLLFLDATAPREKIKNYILFFQGRVTDLQGGGSIVLPRKNKTGLDGILFGNQSLRLLYYQLASELLPDFQNDPARFVVSPKDTSGLYFSNKTDRQGYLKWAEKNLVTIDLYHAGSTRKFLFQKILELLNEYSFYTASVKTMPQQTYVLRCDQNRTIRQIPIPSADILKLIRANRTEKFPIVDSTGLAELPHNGHLPSISDGMSGLKAWLKEQGLKVSVEFINLPQLIIEKKEYYDQN